MLTEKFLKERFKQNNLSEAEAEVVFLAINNVSIEKISKDLKISANAVRKRLGEVYDKLGVDGRGPGKLAKLQQMLLLECQAQNSQRIWIWWSGSYGQHLAETLKNTIFSYPQLETQVCSLDPVICKAWCDEVEKSLRNVDIAIGCLTPGDSENVWVNYAAGFLARRIRNQLIYFSENLCGPLAHMSAIDGKNREELATLLQKITNSNYHEAKEWVEFKFSQLYREIKEPELQMLKASDADKLIDAIDSIKETENYLKANKYVQENICFELIILNSVTLTRNQLLAVNSDYLIPAVLYPQRLISLQKEWKAGVKAIALVDHQEQFWSEAVGREILNTTDNNSTRVFVFTRPEDFDRNFEMLLEHAGKYNVYVINYKMLARKFQGFVKDFSIIQVSHSKVVAEYVESNDKTNLKNIRFSADIGEVNKHEEKIAEIINSEVTIPVTEVLQEIISSAQKIQINDFEALQKLGRIQDEIRTNVRKRLFA